MQYIFAALAGSFAPDFGAQVVGLSAATAWITAAAVGALTLLLLPTTQAHYLASVQLLSY